MGLFSVLSIKEHPFSAILHFRNLKASILGRLLFFAKSMALSCTKKTKLGISSHVNMNHYHLILNVCCSNSKYHLDQTQKALPNMHYLGVTRKRNRKRNCSYLLLSSLQSCVDWCIQANNMKNISHFLAKKPGFWHGCHTQKRTAAILFSTKSYSDGVNDLTEDLA